MGGKGGLFLCLFVVWLVVLVCFCLLAGWSVGCLVGRLVGCLVGSLVGWLGSLVAGRV